MGNIFQRFRRDIIGILWLATGVFVAAALATYAPTDPSFNSIGRGLAVQNACGYFGSFLSDILYQIFGVASWCFVLAAARMSLLSFRGRDARLHWTRFALGAVSLAVMASLVALYAPKFKIFSQQIHLGGSLGLIISASLIKVFNFTGAMIILWTAALTLMVFFTERPVASFFEWPIRIWSRAVAYVSGLSFFSKKVTVQAEEEVSSGEAAAPLFSFKLKNEESVKSADVEEADEAEEIKPEPIVQLPLKRRRVHLPVKVQMRIENWELPKLSLLEDPPVSRYKVDEKEIKQKANLLVDKFEQFSVNGNVVGVKPGPAVTMFEFKPNVDVKISRITELADDLSMALSSESVRIIAPIPGRDVVGIETSNSHRETVFLKDILGNEDFWDDKIKLPIALGRQADGEPRVVDLRKMPHLLVAGTTGSGKSVFVVSLLSGLLFRHSPKTLRLILIDPKQVDLAAFNRIPHLLMPPIREPKKAVGALRWAIREMEKRYRSMSKFGARGIESFNEIVAKFSSEEIEKHQQANQIQEGQTKPLEEYYYTQQPYIVVVVEEFGDLMAVDKGNVEQNVVRLAQMARACGIHLILAMQSPRKDVVTGLIKTNIPGRISFKVASKMDSRIILDESGAERLLAQGDMLFLAPGVAKPQRHHGAWLTEQEVAGICSFWSEQGEPEFDPMVLRSIEGPSEGAHEPGGDFEADGEDGFDERYDEVLAYVSSLKEVSASLLQRKFRLGYPRAARIIEIFEQQGVVGAANGSKPRTVLVNQLK